MRQVKMPHMGAWQRQAYSLRDGSEEFMDALDVSLSNTAMATPPSATSLGRIGLL
jgi:hypothetical protein